MSHQEAIICHVERLDAPDVSTSDKLLSAVWSKRVFDVVGALGLIVLFLPLMAVVYALIRLDGGPAVFAHARVGANGRRFKVLKFRTMVQDADTVLAELLARDAAARAEWERDFKLQNDPRITGVGRFLRRSSLDELPQLFNVLAGSMSLVGPRPIVHAEVSRYGAAIADYYRCKPGLTGLWQVSGRNDVSYAERVALDSLYVRSWSFWADIWLMFRTVGVVINRSGAY